MKPTKPAPERRRAVPDEHRSTRPTKRLVRRALVVVSVLPLLGSCTGPDLQQFDDASDSCNGFRRPIIATQSTEQQERLQQAAVGAAVGAVLGGILGAATGSDDWWIGSLAGAAAGGIGGYSRAYFEQQAERARSREELFRLVNADASAEKDRLSRTSAAVIALRDCRTGEIRELAGDFEAGRVDRAAAQARLGDIRSRIDQDNRLVTAMLDGTEERVNAYVDATAVSAEVERSLIYTPTTQTVARADPDARRRAQRAQRRAPAVPAVAEAKDALASSDEIAREQLAREVDAMAVLLS